MSGKDAEYIWNLMPSWVTEPYDGLPADMYGTLSFEGDAKVIAKVKEILGMAVVK
jgi:hypothetical protein